MKVRPLSLSTVSPTEAVVGTQLDDVVVELIISDVVVELTVVLVPSMVVLVKLSEVVDASTVVVLEPIVLEVDV